MRRAVLLNVVLGGSNPNAGYSLYDRFGTDLAAGSVNGTFADTGQARTVTDTNSKLSVAGGQMSIATGGNAAGDPGLWYPQMTRQAGMTLLASIVLVSNALEIGWDAAQSGNISFCFRFLNASSILAVRDNITAITVGATPALATTYNTAFSLRASGCFYFIKGGIYTNWTLIWISIASSASLFPGLAQVNTTDIITADNIRVPTTLYVPQPLAYDTFTRANGALGSTETSGPDSQVLVALAWNFTTGVWTISTNKAIATPTPGSDVIVNGGFGADSDWSKGAGWSIAAGVAAAVTASSNLTATVAPLTAHRFYLVVYTLSGFGAGTVQAVIGGKSMPTHAANATYTEIGLATTTAFLFTGAGFTGSLDNVSAKALVWADVFATVACSTADVFVDAAITIVGATSGLPAGIVVNLDSTSSPANFVLVYLDGNGNCVSVEMVAGVITIKATTAITYSVGAVLRVERSVTECRVFYNNAAVGAALTMTSNVSLNHGIFDPTALNSLDNATIWARGTSGEYAALNAF